MPTIFWGNSTIIARLLWKPWKFYTAAPLGEAGGVRREAGVKKKKRRSNDWNASFVAGSGVEPETFGL